MRIFIAGAVLLSGLAAQVPVDQEPRHRLVFADEALRILEVRIPPGDATLEHAHAKDDIYVCIHGSSVKGRQPGGEWSNAGPACVPGRTGATSYTGRPGAHAVQNAGAGLYHLVLVENLRPGDWTSAPPVPGPDRKLARESRAFVAYDVELAGVGKRSSHTHELPTVLVLVSGNVTVGEMRLDQPGQWILLRAGEQHQLAGPGEARVVEIEVR